MQGYSTSRPSFYTLVYATGALINFRNYQEWEAPVDGDASQNQNLLGINVSQGTVLKDDMDVTGIFFLFPNLAIRNAGTYRLRFTLFDLNS
jgi:Velvet factor